MNLANILKNYQTNNIIMDYGVIINGVKYLLVDSERKYYCSNCDLADYCDNLLELGSTVMCDVFPHVNDKVFKKQIKI